MPRSNLVPAVKAPTEKVGALLVEWRLFGENGFRAGTTCSKSDADFQFFYHDGGGARILGS